MQSIAQVNILFNFTSIQIVQGMLCGVLGTTWSGYLKHPIARSPT